MMEPGRKLDALIAQTFFDWRWHPIKGDEPYYGDETKRLGGFWLHGVSSINTTDGDGNPNCPAYSTSISAAWQIVDSLQGGLRFELRRRLDGGFWAYFGEEMSAEGDTAPHAICLAGLKTLSKRVREDG